MAVTRGCLGIVKVATADVAEVRSWELSHSAEVLDSSALGASCAKSYTVGATEWSGTVSCWWDATDTTGQEAMAVASTVALSLQPEGDTTGDVTYSGSAIITGITRSGAVDGIVEATFTFTGDGALTEGTAS